VHNIKTRVAERMHQYLCLSNLVDAFLLTTWHISLCVAKKALVLLIGWLLHFGANHLIEPLTGYKMMRYSLCYNKAIKINGIDLDNVENV
jgi:hypothetical protein